MMYTAESLENNLRKIPHV